ncbi:MAG TPA: MFS transporter, partial [Luteolibacter sp.]|nr:MFS transporter [Luteolibacter sp.]
MPRFNILSTRLGRLCAFGGLYVSAGLPQGFTSVALAMEFKRRGMDDAAIGTFTALTILPWTWKFLMGPLVDNLHLRRFGARKQWIVASQIGMLLTLCGALLRMPEVGDVSNLSMIIFTALLVIHNVFAATQDVAIDALACQVLKEDERGIANGIMFGGAQAGSAIGGSAVLALKGVLGGFGSASLLVPLLLCAILIGVITLICEKSAAQEMADGELTSPHPGEHGLDAVRAQIADYARTVGRTIFLTGNGRLGLLMALLPMGGMA